MTNDTIDNADNHNHVDDADGCVVAFKKKVLKTLFLFGIKSKNVSLYL